MAMRDGGHWAVYNDSQHGRETRQLCTDLIALAGDGAARALFDGLDVVRFDRIDEDGPSFSGPKHWHVFDVVAHA